METQEHPDEVKTESPIFTALQNSRRRSVLAILIDRNSKLSLRELATTLTTRDRNIPVVYAPPDDTQRIRLDLRHTHLPVLEDCGFITWEPDEELITTTDHVALSDPRFRRILDLGNEEVDAVLAGLANNRRRLLLAILRDRQEPVSRTTLAREIIQWERGNLQPPQSTFDEIKISLLHTHLPKLGDAGIVEYDTEVDHVAYTGDPVFERILAIFHGPDSRLLKKVDGFLGGLLTSYRQASTSEPFDWPTSWRTPYHG
ncbi:DUF7344 domain-containing protein [Haladaptatus sp. DFWS20]|uniref:DUF7344 domain-containing protein n=1 Tax=Haladaptatus sp. DFWS20 TaxID=3403467 RepID=UPI003EBC0844